MNKLSKQENNQIIEKDIDSDNEEIKEPELIKKEIAIKPIPVDVEKKPVSELAKNARAKNMAVARDNKNKQTSKLKEDKKLIEEKTAALKEEEETIKRLKQTLQDETLKKNRSNDDDDEDNSYQGSKRSKQQYSLELERIMEMVQDSNKKINKMYLMKKTKAQIKAEEKQAPVINNYIKPDNEEKKQIRKEKVADAIRHITNKY